MPGADIGSTVADHDDVGLRTDVEAIDNPDPGSGLTFSGVADPSKLSIVVEPRMLGGTAAARSADENREHHPRLAAGVLNENHS
jgi:hypothetical protein